VPFDICLTKKHFPTTLIWARFLMSSLMVVYRRFAFKRFTAKLAQLFRIHGELQLEKGGNNYNDYLMMVMHIMRKITNSSKM